MAHKVHPIVFRLGHSTSWKSRWFSKKKYRQFLEEDFAIKDFLQKKLEKAAVEDIEIERFGNKVNIKIKTARPGLIIGRGGKEIENLQKELQKKLQEKISFFQKKEIKIDAEEIRKPQISASLVAAEIASELKRRIPFRRVIKRARDRVMQNKEVKGVKIMVKGRLGGTEMAREEHLTQGKIPLQTLRADIDYAYTKANTTYGVIGVKVWVYKGEYLE